MTLNEIANQLYDLAVDGQFNGEHRSRVWLYNYLSRAFSPEFKNTRCVMDIQLPDRKWLFTVTQYGQKNDQYDYWIPDNEEQEKRVHDWLNKDSFPQKL